MRKIFSILSICGFVVLSSFNQVNEPITQPSTITRTTIIENGNTLERTIISLDKHTAREAIIQTCHFLESENVQLTFDKLTIGKRSMFVFSSKSRILFAEGNLTLPNGVSEHFKAGGLTGIRSLKIQYTNNVTTKKSQIEMVEIVD